MLMPKTYKEFSCQETNTKWTVNKNFSKDDIQTGKGIFKMFITNHQEHANQYPSLRAPHTC